MQVEKERKKEKEMFVEPVAAESCARRRWKQASLHPFCWPLLPHS